MASTPSNKLKRYTFIVYLGGDGTTPEEAWQDAIECFQQDPGDEPMTYTEEAYEDARNH